MKNEKTRLSVPMSSVLYAKVEANANKLGVSKASYVSFIVAQVIDQQEIVQMHLAKAIASLPQQALEKAQGLPLANDIEGIDTK